MGSGASMDKTLLVVGGGYTGTTVARALDSKMRVVLLEKEDGLTHRMASLRGAVVPGWERRVRLGEEMVLRNGEIRQATVTRVEPGKVHLADGSQIAADFVVMATGGSGYLFPMGGDGVDKATFDRMLQESQKAIADASSVLIVGGGAVGVEMAGEIRSAYPDKPVTLAHSGAALLDGAPVALPPAFPNMLMDQLTAMGVTVHLNAKVQELPPSPPGPVASAVRPTPGATHELTNGASVTADLVYVATGWASKATYASHMLPSEALDEAGLVRVNDALQVEGMPGVYAVGDCTNVKEAKMAYTGSLQSKIIVKNLRAEAAEKPARATYQPQPEGKVGMLVPLGPRQGAVAFGTTLLGPFVARNLKGKDLMTKMIVTSQCGVAAPAAP